MKEVCNVLNPVNTISVNRAIAHAIGLNEAVVYAALLAKSNYYEANDKIKDGWFFSTVIDLEESTSLTEKQQRKAIKNLIRECLISVELRGMPARRYFKILDNSARVSEIVDKGIEKICELKHAVTEQMNSCRKQTEIVTENKKTYDAAVNSVDEKTFNKLDCNVENSPETVTVSSDKTADQVPPKGQNKFRQKAGYTYKSKYINQKKKISSSDEDDTSIKENYLLTIKQNINYNTICETYPDDKKIIDELVNNMLRAVCSTKKTIRINGENIPADSVKSVMLKLNSDNFIQALNSVKGNPNPVFNKFAYLITVLFNTYNSPSFYTPNPQRPIKNICSNSSFDIQEVMENILAQYQ